MTEQRVSLRYARALLEIAIQQNISKQIYDDFIFVDACLESSDDLRALTISPIVQPWKKISAYKEIFGTKLNELTLSFLLFLLKKKRGELIRSTINQYNSQYNHLNNRLPVEIYSAIELSDSIKNNIVDVLNKKTNKEILPQFKTEPILKGGIKVKIEDWVYDASLRNQLDMLYKRLSEN